MAPVSLSPVQPNEAIAYFRAKGFKTSFAWQDTWQEEHAKAFTVAKAMSADVLQDIRDAVDRALADGTTLATFQKELEPLLKAKGWWGKQPMVDPQTGEEKLVQLGSGRRLKTIFDTNLRVAYAAGRWESYQRTKRTFPYLKYHHLDPQPHPRPEHQAWGGTVLHLDDPWWDEHYPPCDWGCHCWTTALTESMARREPRFGQRPPAFARRSYRNPRTGETVSLERGIGPGWAYNVGKAYLQPLTPPPLTSKLPDETSGAGPEAQKGAPAIEPPEPLPEPIELDDDQLLGPEVEQDEAQAAFLGGFDAAPDETVITRDPSGDNLVVGPGLFRDTADNPVALAPELVRALPIIGQALRHPAEIRQVWLSGPQRPNAPPLSMLARRFIAQFTVGGRGVDVVVDIAKTGWIARTSIEAAGDEGGAFDIQDWRRGILLWPPKSR